MNQKELVKQLQKGLERTRRTTRLAAIGAIVAACAGLGTYSYCTRNGPTGPAYTASNAVDPEKTSTRQARANRHTAALDQLIAQHATIVRKEAGTPSATHSITGNLYIVGQTHWQPAATAMGMKWTGNGDPAHIPDVQADIYHLISSLHKDTGLRLVVGEGLGPVELGANKNFQAVWQQCGKDANKFFRQTTGQLGYTLAKDVLDEKLLLMGVDDTKEMEEIQELEKKEFAIADKYLSMRNAPAALTPEGMTMEGRMTPEGRVPANTKNKMDRTPATRTAPAPQSPEAIQAMMNESAPLREQHAALNDKRSLVYLTHTIAMADLRKEQDVMVVIGMGHVALMAKTYRETLAPQYRGRTLYVLLPKSTPAPEIQRLMNK